MTKQLAGEINFIKNWQRRINIISGTVTGGRKAALTNKLRHGDNFYKRIGREGGQRSCNGGFASDKVGGDGLTGRERAKIVGAKGGKKSIRGSSYETKRKIEANASKIREMLSRGESLTEISRVTGIPINTLSRNIIKSEKRVLNV